MEYVALYIVIALAMRLAGYWIMAQGQQYEDRVTDAEARSRGLVDKVRSGL